MSDERVIEDIGNEDLPRGSRRANPMDVHVGTRVRLRRMLLGMSQEKLGEHLGLTFQQVQKYEKGVNRIGASRLFDLAKVLGVPVQFFYDEAPAGTYSAAEPIAGFAEQLHQRVRAVEEERAARQVGNLAKGFFTGGVLTGGTGVADLALG